SHQPRRGGKARLRDDRGHRVDHRHPPGAGHPLRRDRPPRSGGHDRGAGDRRPAPALPDHAGGPPAAGDRDRRHEGPHRGRAATAQAGLMRKPAAVVSVLLLGLLAVGVAEATLAALMVLFSTILKLNLSVELGPHYLQLTLPPAPFPPALAVYSAGCIAAVARRRQHRCRARVLAFRRHRVARLPGTSIARRICADEVAPGRLVA